MATQTASSSRFSRRPGVLTAVAVAIAVVGAGIVVWAAVPPQVWSQQFVPGISPPLHGHFPPPGHGPPPKPTPVAAGLSPFPTRLRHVVLIVMENRAASDVLANAPYEAYLAHRWAEAANYHAILHPSAPNYLAMTSGSEFTQPGSDNWTVYASPNLGDLIERANLTWRAYLEDMPTPCDTNDSGLYAVRHNPWVFYADIVHNPARCDSHVVSLPNFGADVNASALPTFSYIAPNLIDDGHDSNLSVSDSWLHRWLPTYLNSSLNQTTAFVVTYDEALGSDSQTNNVYFVAAGGGVVPGAVNTANTSHYNLLTTIEWLFHLGSCGNHDNATTAPPLTDLFTAVPPAHVYNVTGTIQTTDHLPASGAAVFATPGQSANASANGRFTIALPNGTYSLVASNGSEASANTTVTVAGVTVGNVSLTLTSPLQFGPNFAPRVLPVGHSSDLLGSATVPRTRSFLASAPR